MVDSKGIGLVSSRHAERLEGKGTRGMKIFYDSAYEEVASAHFNVFHQLERMSPFIEHQIDIILAENYGRLDSGS